MVGPTLRIARRLALSCRVIPSRNPSLQVESDELVAAIRNNDTPVEYVVFPDEGHGFLKTENRITSAEAVLTFPGRYLQ